MTGKTMLPMGIENFEDIRKDDFYYVDKTGMIKELLENRAYVSLFTRPRRFGKTLNMSMLKYFFSIGTDGTLFDGLEISKEKELCSRHLGQYPVISISLKGAEGRSFEEAKGMLRSTIGEGAMGFYFLMSSGRLTEAEQRQYQMLIAMNEKGSFEMDGETLKNSLRTLSQLLQKHYGQKTIILIDEYDVPLDKAYQSGFYDEMVDLIRGLFGQALKTNESLHMAVLTGCLRISRESIFTGLNNFNVHTLNDLQYNACFGFTDAEVKEMLEYYGFMGKYDVIKEWYDGYRFSSLEMYCPWDVISYCHAIKMNALIKPKNYWVNTSSNDIVRMFIDKADRAAKAEIERLINGGSIKKKVRQELTYRDIDADIDNLWSILFTTGYLTQDEEDEDEDGTVGLVIPNKEIRLIYEEQIWEWFKKETRKDTKMLENFCRAFEENNASAIEEGFNGCLRKMISIRDTSVRRYRKENFYQGILLGLLAGTKDWYIKSSAESGGGYSDIIVEIYDKDIGIVIELKYAENASFDKTCQEALRQIEENDYAEMLIDDGMKTILKYGIACYKKRCRVVSGGVFKL